MNELQSKINAAEARIDQLKNSELFNDADRLKLLPKAELELEKLLLEKAGEIVKEELTKTEKDFLKYNNVISEALSKNN